MVVETVWDSIATQIATSDQYSAGPMLVALIGCCILPSRRPLRCHCYTILFEEFRHNGSYKNITLIIPTAWHPASVTCDENPPAVQALDGVELEGARHIPKGYESTYY